MTMFSPETIAALEAPLLRDHVKKRSQAGRNFSYVEGWHAIAEANRIFGFDGWTRETVEIRLVNEWEREIGAAKKAGWGVSYIAKVRVRVGDIVREGIGSGHGIDVDLGLAHESAIKEAETDAMKRALMTFGNPFGLALYDKEQANVADEPAPAREPTMTERLDAAQAYLNEEAAKGSPALRKAWEGLSRELKPALATILNDHLKPIAARADERTAA
jgi:DNA repair and recombination protein RAD52